MSRIIKLKQIEGIILGGINQNISISGDVNFNGFELTNIASGTTSSSAVNVGQLDAAIANLNNTISGTTIQGGDGLSGSGIIGVDSLITLDVNVDSDALEIDGQNEIRLKDTIIGNRTFTGTIVVDGDLVVNGTATTINTQTLSVEDNMVVLNSNLTGGTPTLDSGILVRRGNELTKTLFWDESTDCWAIGDVVPGTENNTSPTISGETCLTTNNSERYVSGATFSSNTLTLKSKNGSDITVDLSALDNNDYYVTGGTVSGNNLALTRNDGNIVNIDVTSLASDIYTTGATLAGSVITYTKNDGNTYNVDLASFGASLTADTYVTGVTYDNNNNLTISQNNLGGSHIVNINTMSGLTVNGILDGDTITSGGTDLTQIFSQTDYYVTGGTLSTGNTLTLTRNDGQDISVSLSGITSTPAAPNRSIQFNDNGAFGGSNFLTYNNQGNLFKNELTLTSSGATDSFGIYGKKSNGLPGFAIGFSEQSNLASFAVNNAPLNIYNAGPTPATAKYDISIQAALNSAGQGGDVKLNSGSGSTASGNIIFKIGSNSTGTGGAEVFKMSDATATSKLSAVSGNVLMYNGSEIIYSAIPATSDYYVTGGTVSGNNLTLTRNDGNTVTVDVTNLASDIYTTGMTFNNGTYDLSITRNDGQTQTVNLGLLTNDVNVTGGTYDINTGVVTFTNNSGNTFNVTGFTSGMTDTYTTGSTFNNTTKIATFTKSDGGTYDLNLSSITTTDYYVTGGTLNANNLELTRNDGNTVTVDLSALDNSDYYVTGGTVSGNNLVLTRNDGNTINVDVTTLAADIYTTGMTFNSGTNELTITRNDGQTYTVDLGDLTSDTYVTGGTISGGTLTINQNNGASNVVINNLNSTNVTLVDVSGCTSGDTTVSEAIQTLTDKVQGLLVSAPSVNDKNLTGYSATSNTIITGLTLTDDLSYSSHVFMMVNGQMIGFGETTSYPVYFGTVGSPIPFSSVTTSSTIVWNKTVIGWDLETNDVIDLIYNTNFNNNVIC